MQSSLDPRFQLHISVSLIFGALFIIKLRIQKVIAQLHEIHPHILKVFSNNCNQ